MERFPLPDGDFLRIRWNGDRDPQDGEPLVVLLHGLGGSSDSPYVRGIAAELWSRGVVSVAVNFRGCGGVPNERARGYHSGETGDMEALMSALRERFPGCSLRAAGASLGGNALLCHLGRRGTDSPLDRAVAVCPPLDLHACIRRMSAGLSRGYHRYLLRCLKRDARLKEPLLREAGVDLDALFGARSFRDFDNVVTAPLHGFADADAYYTASSSGPLLKHITVPTTVLFAADDPFMVPSMIPDESALSAAVRFEVSASGGHVGFAAGGGRYWLDSRVPDVLLADAAATAASSAS